MPPQRSFAQALDMFPHLPSARPLVRTLAACALALLTACAAGPESAPRNRGLTPATAAHAAALDPRDTLVENSVMLSFSGGGARAAAFTLGALQGLDTLPNGEGGTLLDQVRFITSVSGGSMTAAYFGLHGKAGLPEFRRLALLGDSEGALRTSLFNPRNIWRLLSGGLNDRSTLPTWLERSVFKGATFAQMSQQGRPVVWINATNLRQRIAFPFHQRAFDALCSDLSSFPVSEAVAASMAVPVVFTPIVLEKHPERCQAPLPDWVDSYGLAFGDSMLAHSLLQTLHDFRDLGTGRYVKLVDGGLSDNFGLSSIQQSHLLMGTPHAPWSERDAIRIRNLLFVVVDGGQQPSGNLNQDLDGPSGIDLAMAAIDAAIDTNVRLSYDSFVQMIRRWQDDTVRYRCKLPDDAQRRIRDRQPGWRCDDVQFTVTRLSFGDLAPARAQALNAIPTRLKLPEHDIDALIEAGRDAMAHSLSVRYFAARAQGVTDSFWRPALTEPATPAATPVSPSTVQAPTRNDNAAR